MATEGHRKAIDMNIDVLFQFLHAQMTTGEATKGDFFKVNNYATENIRDTIATIFKEKVFVLRTFFL